MNAKCLFLGATCELILCLNPASPSASGTAPIDYTLTFKDNGSDVAVQARAWLPETTDRLRGLLLSIPGSGTDTRGLTGNSAWQFRLTQMGFGIVGFRDKAVSSVLPGSSKDEIQANFQFLMDTVANSFSHPEIKNAPVIFDGISKGGYAVSFLAPYLSDRTICYIADKGYLSPFVEDLEDLQVPGLVIGGAYDNLVPPDFVQSGFAGSRSNDATLAMLVDWQHGHESTYQFTKLAFMDQALRVRYPQNQLPALAPNTPLPLIDVSHLAGAWLGESNPLDDNLNYVPLDNPTLTPAAIYPKDPSLASWLPTEVMAMVYRAHNDSTFTNGPIQIGASSFVNGQAVLNFALSRTTINVLRLYHEEELIATFGPGSIPSSFTYTAKQNGLHTFIAVADYLDGGVMKQSFNYTATVVGGVVTVPEPGTAVLLLGPAIGCLRRKQYGRLTTNSYSPRP